MTDQTERLEQLEGRRRLVRPGPLPPRLVSTDPLTMAREAVRQAQVVRDRLRRHVAPNVEAPFSGRPPAPLTQEGQRLLLDELDGHLTDARHHLDRARAQEAD